ncbi:MAG: SusD/RagB family nutrient-binding outer membrane lipoprotein, partial [Bacteroidales bacterium]|nr:SusD/RagB family nutrient-binding outer membrane lipoprotein [Bacteroidales bacterium]
AGVKYESNAVNAAPMYRAYVVDAREDFAPSMQLVELLQGKRSVFGADPRLDIYVADNKDGFKVGIPLTSSNGEVAGFNYESFPGGAVLAADYTEIYMEYSEVCFIQSELNGWDQTWYEAGVEASMQKWGVAQADIDAFITTLPAASEETVMMQKYIALYMQPYEAWSELRRTGYPNTLVQPNETYDYTWPYVNDAGEQRDSTVSFTFLVIETDQLPNRVRYVLNEGSVNQANYEAAQTAMGGDELESKMWWQP